MNQSRIGTSDLRGSPYSVTSHESKSTMGDLNGSKFLAKMQARKLKQVISTLSTPTQSLPPTPQPQEEDPLAFLTKSLTNNTLNESSIGRKPESKDLDPREELLHQEEKKLWLNKIQEENIALLKLYDDLQETKLEMNKRIKELEIAREKIRLLKSAVTPDNLENYLTTKCELNESKLQSSTLNQEKYNQAKEVFAKMQEIAVRFKSNQQDMAEHILKEFSNISYMLLRNRETEALNSLDSLDKIIASDPKNIGAIDILSISLEKVLISSSSDRFSKILQEEIHKKLGLAQFELETKKKEEEKAIQQEAIKPLPVETVDVKKYVDEIQTLSTQNQSLRDTIANLRKKLAQSRLASTNQNHSSFYGVSRKPSSGIKDDATAFSVVQPKEDTTSDNLNLTTDSNIKPVDLSQSNEILKKANLPFVQERVLGILVEHPLYGQVSTGIQSLVLEEVSTFMTQTTLPIISNIMQTNPHYESLSKPYESNELTESILAQSDIRILLHELVSKAFSISSVYNETLTRITLFLSYAIQRLASTMLQETERLAANQQGTSTPGAPTPTFSQQYNENYPQEYSDQYQGYQDQQYPQEYSEQYQGEYAYNDQYNGQYDQYGQYPDQQYTDQQYTDQQYNDQQYADQQYTDQQYADQQYGQQYDGQQYAESQQYNAEEQYSPQDTHYENSSPYPGSTGPYDVSSEALNQNTLQRSTSTNQKKVPRYMLNTVASRKK